MSQPGGRSGHSQSSAGRTSGLCSPHYCKAVFCCEDRHVLLTNSGPHCFLIPRKEHVRSSTQVCSLPPEPGPAYPVKTLGYLLRLLPNSVLKGAGETGLLWVLIFSQTRSPKPPDAEYLGFRIYYFTLQDFSCVIFVKGKSVSSPGFTVRVRADPRAVGAEAAPGSPYQTRRRSLRLRRKCAPRAQ